MKTILISIHPEYCEKIFSGEKTIEIRKTTPEPPFKAVVYEPKKNGGNGKVIGEFIVNEITNEVITPDGSMPLDGTIRERACLSKDEVMNYFKPKKECVGYALYITAPKLYEKPRELGEFKKTGLCEDANSPISIECYPAICEKCPYLHLPVTCPPQNYMYIQDTEEEK